MVELYYKNLGIAEPEWTQRQVHNRLFEFKKYLNKYKDRVAMNLFRFKYKTYTVHGKVIIPNFLHGINKKTIIEKSLDEKQFYYDENGLNEIPKKQFIDGTVFFFNEEPDFIYCRIENKIISLRYVPDFYELHEISYEDHQEYEDKAFNILKFSKFIIEDPNDKNLQIKKIRTSYQSGKIRLTKLPRIEGNAFWVQESTHTIDKKIQALEYLANSPQRHHLPLLNLLRSKKTFKWPPVDPQKSKDLQFYILTNSSQEGITEQRDFVKKALSTPDFAILDGPPGSGKTTVLLEIIAQLTKQKKRVLMVGSTHVAVDNILERLDNTTVKIGNKEKILRDVCGAFPIRIGEEDAISESSKKYLLDNQAATEKKRILDALERNKDHLSNPQKRLLTCLTSDEDKANEIIQNFVIDAANLVCGTTIGFLQDERIKNSQLNLAEPLFDTVIIDEASKTTFQEFLVPGLYGERWIISGDVKQLSPFVDGLEVLANIKGLSQFDENYAVLEKKICLLTFLSIKKYFLRKSNDYFNGAVLHVVNNDEIRDRIELYYKQQIAGLKEKFGSDFEYINKYTFNLNVFSIKQIPFTDEEKVEVFGSDILIINREFLHTLRKDIEDCLPPNIIYCDDELSADYQLRRQIFFELSGKLELLPSILNDKRWDEEINWRICKLHDIKNNPEKYIQLSSEIDLLLPYFDKISDQKSDHEENTVTRAELIKLELDEIRRIALPSVIELLQSGFELGDGYQDIDQIALYGGLDYCRSEVDILSERLTALTFQHRMHPDISQFPRNNIYSGTALRDSGEIREKREWKYSRYNSHAVWVNVIQAKDEVQSQIERGTRGFYNMREIDRMIDEFVIFKDWAKNNVNESSEKKWSVAFLTFYTDQRNLLREKLYRFSNKDGDYSEFYLDQEKIYVNIHNVDSFQGHEADVVFLSLVRSEKGKKGIGFLIDNHRINVALTRAKYQLVVFGDRNHFKKQRDSLLLKKLAEECEQGPKKIGRIMEESA